MLRLVGIFIGSSLAVALLINLLGLPRFSPPGDSVVTAVVTPVPEPKAKSTPIEPVAVTRDPVPLPRALRDP